MSICIADIELSTIVVKFPVPSFVSYDEMTVHMHVDITEWTTQNHVPYYLDMTVGEEFVLLLWNDNKAHRSRIWGFAV